jgi:RNA recognition motif-containing protein
MSIYVGNLPFAASQEDVNSIFAEYGTVKSVQIPTDRETGRVRGFGFVEMETEAEETAAIEALNSAEWMSRELKANRQDPALREVRLVIVGETATGTSLETTDLKRDLASSYADKSSGLLALPIYPD